MKRFALFFAGLFMLVVFGIGAVASLPIFACALAWFLVSGSDEAREFVGFKGKALDQVCNAVYFGGHPKETVSSHAGRFYEAKYGNRYKGRPASDPDIEIPLWAKAVHAVTEIAEKGHVLKAVEEPFLSLSL
jgi:hypothetical protein